ncbi:MAG: hypothetical protein EXR72_13515 [Myxococcales bacterium]|nr:hypothetical protein [Myxococcales bacterium]
MRRLLPLLAALYSPAAAAPPKGSPPEARSIAAAADGLREVLAQRPRVIAFGEYHQKKGASAARSSIRRFTDELLPLLPGQASDLIVETWVTEGNCGEKEKQVVAEVQETTRRPEVTESEVVTLIKRAKAAGITPHILKLTCDEYQDLLGGGTAGEKGKEVDYAKLLFLVNRKLAEKIDELVAARADPAKAIAVYGGALHNDLYPRSELREFVFGPSVHRKVAGRYREVDLFVPEYIEADEGMKREAWYAPYRKQAKPGKAVLVRRRPDSWIIVFPRTAE